MKNIFKFGEDVEGYNIPVLNEREIRAAAGILFILMFVSIQQAGQMHNFTMLKYAIVIFLTDMIIRVFISPRFSPTLILGRLIVGKQTPEYVGAPQKKFAWIIGNILAVVMFIHLVLINGYSPITGIICMICLIFLFFEAAFGICLGCKFYPLFFKDKVQYCPGEVCDVKSKQAIQKTSLVQLLIVFGFIAYMVLIVFMFKTNFSKQPYDVFGIEKYFQSK
jgi:hypothetical protein